MDKEEKKRLKRLYKEQELQNFIKNNDGGIIGEVLSEYAKNRLGVKCEPLTEKDILEIEEPHLIETVYQKLQNYVNWLYKRSPKHFKSVENTLLLQSSDLIFIDAFYSFQSLHLNGGIENFMYNSTDLELKTFQNGLFKYGLQDFLEVFLSDDPELISAYYKKHKERIDETIVKYIREHPEAFTLE